MSALKARIERGAAASELPPRTDVAGLARFYATVFEGLSIQARDGATADDLAAVGAAAMRAWPVIGLSPAELAPVG